MTEKQEVKNSVSSDASNAPSAGVEVWFIGPRPEIEKEGDPFAAVVGTTAQPVKPSCSRVCLLVSRTENGEFCFRDGVLAVDKGWAQIGHVVEWPELHRALSLPVKGFEGITNSRPNEPRYLRVKNLEEDGYAAVPPDPDAGYGANALRLLKNWNRWIQEDVTFNGRAADMDPALKFSAELESAADSLRKFCGELGLNKNRRIDFEGPWKALSTTLKQAELLHAGVRRKLSSERK